jgi:hypothetical protein
VVRDLAVAELAAQVTDEGPATALAPASARAAAGGSVTLDRAVVAVCDREEPEPGGGPPPPALAAEVGVPLEPGARDVVHVQVRHAWGNLDRGADADRDRDDAGTPQDR